METLVSAVLGDLVSRSVSFVIDKYYRQQKGAAENLQRLHRMLLRVQATVEEAEGRHITNNAMLQQLQMLREAMYRGSYLLDAFSYMMLQQERPSDQVGDQPLSKFSPAKLLCFSTRRVKMEFKGDGVTEVRKMLESLHSILDDMTEFIVFLKSYPPMSRQPYSMHLFLEKCMFGRQSEMEKIINFLLQPEPPGTESLQVLPIIGPPRVGKSTLVEHVCYDERVRRHFSSIILCTGDPTAPEGSVVAEKQAHGSHGRSLTVVELDDLVVDERQCRKLYASGSHMPPGSKVIITSRTESIVKLGTVGAIRLKFLPQEAYWYFFKVMTFGSTNPQEHSELASIAMEIAAELDGSFLGANIFSGLLRANSHVQFWRKILELQRNHVKGHILLFGEHPHTLLQKNQPIYPWHMCKSNKSMCLKVQYREKRCHLNEVPKIMLHEVQIGSAEAHGKLEVVVWNSHIPPYHSYLISCEMEAPLHMKAKNKRPHSIM